MFKFLNKANIKGWYLVWTSKEKAKGKENTRETEAFPFYRALKADEFQNQLDFTLFYWVFIETELIFNNIGLNILSSICVLFLLPFFHTSFLARTLTTRAYKLILWDASSNVDFTSI